MFWSDADAVILNHSIPLEHFIDNRADLIMTAGPEWSGKWKGFINSGHFLARDSEFTRKFLKQTWELRSAPCSEEMNGTSVFLNGWWNVCLKNNKCCEMGEQSAFMILLDENPMWKRHVKYVGFRGE